MKIQVQYYGLIAEITGRTHENWIMNLNSSIVEIQHNITTKYPDLKKQSYVIALNDQLVNDKQIVQNEDIIALLPPFAGG